MTECLQGLRIALLAADGVGQTELDASVDAVRQAGAQTRLLSLRTGQIESLDRDLGPGRTYTVDQTVGEAAVDEYDALLMVPGMVKPHQLSSDDDVVEFVRGFITSGKPVGVVCRGAWTLLEAGVARCRNLPSYVTMRAVRQTGASILDGEVSPQVLRGFYGTIVEEFARLARPHALASAGSVSGAAT
jgi:protease I